MEKKSGFVDSGFVKTCDELVIGSLPCPGLGYASANFDDAQERACTSIPNAFWNGQSKFIVFKIMLKKLVKLTGHIVDFGDLTIVHFCHVHF